MTTHATPPVLGIPGATADLSARLRDGLSRVDALLTQVVDHEDPFIAGASGTSSRRAASGSGRC